MSINHERNESLPNSDKQPLEGISIPDKSVISAEQIEIGNLTLEFGAGVYGGEGNNQDEVKVIKLNELGEAAFVVADGHGRGLFVDVKQKVSESVERIIRNYLELRSSSKNPKLEENDERQETNEVESQAEEVTLESIQAKLLKSIAMEMEMLRKEKGSEYWGYVFSIAIVNKLGVVLANVGDVEGFRVEGDEVEGLTELHNTSNEVEVDRIRTERKDDRAVVYDRGVLRVVVDGVPRLAVTREISPFEIEGVSTKPHLHILSWEEMKDGFLLIASDGLLGEKSLEVVRSEMRDTEAIEKRAKFLANRDPEQYYVDDLSYVWFGLLVKYSTKEWREGR